MTEFDPNRRALFRRLSNAAQSKQTFKLVVGHACNPQLSIYCQSCVEVCEQKALSLEKGEKPIVDPERCNECSLCITACEFNALSLKPV